MSHDIEEKQAEEYEPNEDENRAGLVGGQHCSLRQAFEVSGYGKFAGLVVALGQKPRRSLFDINILETFVIVAKTKRYT